MSRIVTRNRLAFPAGRKPGFDPTHPAAAKAARIKTFSAAAFSGNINSMVSLLDGQIPVSAQQQNSFTSAPVDSVLGPTQFYNGAANWVSNVWHIDPTYFKLASATAETIAAIIRPTTLAGINYFIISAYNSDADSAADRGLGISAASNLQWLFSGSQAYDSGLALTAGVPYFCVASVSVPDGSNGFVDFLVEDLSTGKIRTSHVTIAATGNFTVSSQPSVSAGWVTHSMIGNLAAVMFNNNVYLPPPMLLQWARDPWSFWYPENA